MKMDKFNVFDWAGFTILVLLLVVAAYTYPIMRITRDHNECFMPKEECWITDVNDTIWYGGFWCDCDNFIKKSGIIVKENG